MAAEESFVSGKSVKFQVDGKRNRQLWLRCMCDIPMMAAAMASTDSQPVKYSDLAKAEAEIVRTLPGDAFERVRTDVAELECVHVVLRFGFSGAGVAVEGKIDCKAKLPCNWCLEPLSYRDSFEFSSVLVHSEAAAVEWVEFGSNAGDDGSAHSVVVVGEVFDVVELIEDELLLQIPQPDCGDLACEYRPKPGEDDGTSDELRDRIKPFEQLADMMASKEQASRQTSNPKMNDES